MFGKFPPLVPAGAPTGPVAYPPAMPRFPAPAMATMPPAMPGLARPPMAQGPSQPMRPVQPVQPVQPAAQGKDVLLMIRQGVAKQDRAAVKTALQLAHQLQTPIEPPILDMLKKWLGDEAFNAAMGKETPRAPAASATPAKSAPEPAPVEKPPLVLIREGVAAQNKEAVRAALRTAVAQDTQIDAPVLEMLRKWLGEDDEALNTLATRRGIQLDPAVAQSTGKAPGTAPAAAAPKTVPAKVGHAPFVPGAVAPKAEPSQTAPAAEGPAEAKVKAPAPMVVPPKPKAVPQPVIRRGPVLKNAEPAPDLDASFDAFMQEIDTKEPEPENEEPGQEAKRRKVEAEVPEPAEPAEEKEPSKPKEASPSPSPPAARAPVPKRPAMRKPPEAKITKDEWGRDVVPEKDEQEKEAWQYLQEARAAAQTSVWGAGNFINFEDFK